MIANIRMPACLVVATLFAGAAAAQDRPSWRTLQEQPSRPEVPPDIERPEYEFSVSRDQLMGFSRGADAVESESEPAPAEPESLEPYPSFEPSALVPAHSAGLDAAAARGPTQPETGSDLGPPPEEAFTDATIDPAEPFDGPFDTDPAPMPNDASAVAIEEPSSAESIESPVEDQGVALPLDTELEDQAGLAFVETRATPASELESIDRRAPISAAFVPEPVAASAGSTGVDPAFDYRLVRKRTVEPEYPRQAYRARLEGWVNLRVTVTPDGAVEDVSVTESKPRRIFDESAVRAVRQWRFEPPGLAGVTTPQSGVYRISYTMGDR